ncbi:MAG: ribose 1,5-bisphosphate isomerase [Candidatus Altiarchaeota archaeon]
MKAKVDVVAEKIRSMKVRGARDIAIAAVEALEAVMREGGSPADMRRAGSKLKKARPSAISLPNAVNYVLYLVDKNRDEEDFRQKTAAEIADYLRRLNESLERIATIGASIINPGETILTHCQSDTVAQILMKAWDQGKKIKAVCTEARPRHQGYITASLLSKHGIPTTLIIDSAVYYMMQELNVDKVIVGADTIYSDGDIVNKIGTAQIALAAKKMNIPLIVAAESIKFSPESIIGKMVKIEERDPDEVTRIPKVKIRNPAFDITQSEYVDVIITEEGIMPPQEAFHLLTEKFSWGLKHGK